MSFVIGTTVFRPSFPWIRTHPACLAKNWSTHPRTFSPGSKDGLFLLDFVFSTDESRKALVNYFKRDVIKGGYKGAIAFCKEGHHTEAALKRSGFLKNAFSKGPLHEKTPFIFYSDEETLAEFQNSSSWSITSYDHDAS